MKKRSVVLPALMILCAALFISVIPTEAEGALYEDTIRLHILAASDSEEDQALKLEIRDALLKNFAEELSRSEGREDAEIKIREALPEIEEFVRGELLKRGYNYKVSATLGTEWYDTREYESFSLPKGYYTSLKITLGEGSGKNWWCVMFPPLCLDAALEAAPTDDGVKHYTDEEFTLISKKGYNVKFKLLEVVSDVFSRKTK